MPVETPTARWSFEAIGTTWSIDTERPLSDDVRSAVDALIADFDAAWSRFRPDSLVSDLAHRPGRRPIPADGATMLDLYAELDDATDGAVNPLVGDALARLGYGADYALVAGEPTPAPAWRDVVRWDADEIEVRAPVTLDVGALGKGRLVDLVLRAVAARIDGGVVVDGSGDIAVHVTPQRVALEHPYDARRAIGIVDVQAGALCASATTRRAWGDGLHHVLDARTGMPVEAYVATWAFGVDAMHADALATALFFPGGPELAHHWGAHWVRMSTDGRVEWSRGCPVEVLR